MAEMALPAPSLTRAPAEQLKSGELSLLDTTAIATASVAPAYSLGTTLFLVVAATGVGLAAPAAILVSFFPVFFIALAYSYMNRKDPNCGASYSWIARTLNPFVGWLTGWIQLAANVIFCISAPLFAGAVLLALLGPGQFGWISAGAAGNTALIALVAFALLAFVAWMVARGIRITANAQWVMVTIEYLVILGFSVLAFIKVLTTHPAGSTGVAAWWFNPFSLQGITGLSGGAVLGVFFFWGWDTAANLNEEGTDNRENPGRAGLISMGILLVLFLLAAAAMQSLLGEAQINRQGANALTFFAGQLAPAPLSFLMAVAILSSSLATTQTTLLPSSRLSLSMARDGVFPRIFGFIHRRWQTPVVGTLVTFLLCSLGILLTTLSSDVNSTFSNMISDIGILVALYYGATGIACAWAFRHVLLHDPVTLVLAGILPLFGGLFLFWIGYQVIAQGVGAAIPVLITIGLGIPLGIVAVLTNRNGFFRMKTVAYREVGVALNGVFAGRARSPEAAEETAAV
ncbi:MAG TPA: APC family permease [Candidatus Binatia bacterium]|nr:APC family permease [Candidatus Binatia bacterium]